MAGVVGNVRVNFSGDTGGLTASADAAAAKMEAFGGSATKATGGFIHLNTHMLESRKTIGLFAHAVGTTAGPFMHLIHAFGMFGPIAGGAVVGALAAKHAFESCTESINAMAAATEKTVTAMKSGSIHNMAEEYHVLNMELLQGSTIWETYIGTIGKIGPLGRVAEWMGLVDLDSGNKRLEQTKSLMTDLQKAMQLTKEGKWGEGHHGGGASHIMKAVSGGSLGVLRLEHAGHDPNTTLLAQIAKNTAPKPNSLSMNPALAG